MIALHIERLDWAERMAVLAVVAAAVALIAFGGFLSAIAFMICGLMGWSGKFDGLRAQGKAALSGRGRMAVATVMAVAGIAFIPGRHPVVSKQEGVSTDVFGARDAVEACERGVLARASHPSTVEFPMLDHDFREYSGEKSQLLMSAKARNGFNLLLTYDVECEFTAGRLDKVIMSEASGR